MHQATPDRVDRALSEWRGRSAKVVTARVAVAKRIAVVAATLERAGAAALRAFELDPGEFDTLAVLLRQGEPYELTPRALAESGFVSSSGMTKRLDRLEQRGLVRRRPDPHDRRGVRVALTPDGVAMAEQALPAHAEALDGALQGLTDGDVERLDRLLRGVG